MIPAFVNPGARNATQVERALAKAGCFETRAILPGEVTQAVRQAVAGGAMRIAAAGGDGTISAAAAAIAGTDVELVVLPAGTFNHFARDHDIPLDLDAACAVARSSAIRTVDVGTVSGRLFLNTSSVGVYANFVRVRERFEPRFGYHIASTLSAIKTFAHMKPFRLRFEADGMARTYETPLVFIGLGEREIKLPTLGNRVADGRSGLHVLVVRGRTRARLVALSFAAAARGVRALSRTPHLDSFLVTRCTVEQRHSTVAVDGEVVTMPSPLEYQLLPDAVNLVVPG